MSILRFFTKAQSLTLAGLATAILLIIASCADVSSNDSGNGGNGGTDDNNQTKVTPKKTINALEPAIWAEATVTATKITLEWAEVKDAVSYQVIVSKNEDLSSKDEYPVSLPAPNQKLTFEFEQSTQGSSNAVFAANTKYYFQILAKGDGTKNLDSKSVIANWKSSARLATPKLATPKNVKLDGYGIAVIGLNALAPNVANYRLYLVPAANASDLNNITALVNAPDKDKGKIKVINPSDEITTNVNYYYVDNTFKVVDASAATGIWLKGISGKHQLKLIAMAESSANFANSQITSALTVDLAKATTKTVDAVTNLVATPGTFNTGDLDVSWTKPLNLNSITSFMVYYAQKTDADKIDFANNSHPLEDGKLIHKIVVSGGSATDKVTLASLPPVPYVIKVVSLADNGSLNAVSQKAEGTPKA